MGISDLAFVICSGVVTDTLSMAFSQFPSMVLFAKVTPKYIEATVFALLTGCSNLSNSVISPLLGNLINDFFVGVNRENLDHFSVLIKI